MDHLPDNHHDQEPPHGTDEQLVDSSVEASKESGLLIPHEVARVIAALLNEWPATMEFARTGGIDLEGLADELMLIYDDPGTTQEVRDRIDCLRDYVAHRDNYGPVEGWDDLWVSPAYNDEDCCSTCGEHFSYSHAPNCPRLLASTPEQEPGLEADLMALLNKDAGQLFDVSERRRIVWEVERYIKANYVHVDEVAAMNVGIRREELSGMNGVLDELTKDQEPPTSQGLRMLGRMTLHLEGRVRAIKRILERKPD